MKTNSTLAILCLLFLFTLPAKADHIMGSDIRWESLGNDSFKVIVTAYRDCNGSDISAGTISLISQCSGASTAISVTKSSGEDITPTCDTGCTRCSDANCTDTRFGIQRYEITGYVKIDRTKCCKWKIAWGQCCRSSAITTGAGGKNYYNEAFIDICIGEDNNSPYYGNPPTVIFCKDKCVTYYPAVRDDDTVAGRKDSLVFKLGNPLETQGYAIPYAPGYDYDEPLSYYGDPDKNADWVPNCEGFHIDPVTGILNFKPTKEEESVIVIITEEWREDSLGVPRKISEIRRDLQVAVISCPDNDGPIISNWVSTYTFCTNKENCITFPTFDLDKGDTVILSSYTGDLPGATFNPDNGKKWPKGSFCWQPTEAQVRSAPYKLMLEVQDNACPYPNYQAREISIYVRQSTSAQMQINKVDSCGTYSFLAIPDSIYPVAKYSWLGEGPLGDTVRSNDSAFTYRYSRAGTYKMHLTVTGASGCATTYTDSVVVPPMLSVELPHHSISCTAKYNIPAQVHDGVAPYTYTWSTGDTGVNTLEDIVVDRDTFFMVTVTDARGCSVSDSMHISITTGNGPTGKIEIEQTGCHQFKFTAVADSPSDVIEYLWEGEVPKGDRPIWIKMQSFKYVYSDTGYYKMRLTMTSASGCKTVYIDSVWAYHPHVSFIIDSLGGGTYKFIPDDTTHGEYWWNFGDSSVSTEISPIHTYTASGTYKVLLKIIDSTGACLAFDTQTVTVYITTLTGRKNKPDWKIYPNPINGNKLVVEAPQTLDGEVRIMLFDAKGRRVLEVDKVRDRKTMITLPEDMQPGTYLIKIQGDRVYSTEVLVK